jgi:glycosyltransferase involved in cell wall biosynthesis
MAEVSVIVPARNAAASLGRALDAVTGQKLTGKCEVIVVDDASSDDTASVAEAAGARVVRLSENVGSAGARNAGVAVATAPVLAFTDSDCEPAPGWLSAGLACLRDADLVQGAVHPSPGVPVRPLDRTVSVTRESGLYETANLFVRRELFERVGGFWPLLHGESGPAGDERLPGMLLRRGASRFGGHFGEDLWFGWRARRAGARTRFCPSAVVHHEVVRRGPAQFMVEQTRLRFFPAAVRQVPELREHFFYGRWFLSRRTAAFDLAVLAVLGAFGMRRASLLVAVLPYVALTAPAAGNRRRPRAWVWALARLPGDAVGCMALVCGSAAARAPVL